MNKDVTKQDMLSELCYCYCLSFKSELDYIQSIPELAKTLSVPEYNISLCIKELVQDGLVKKAHDCGITEEGYPFCCYGYCITEAAKETEIYFVESERVNLEIDNFFEFNKT